MFAQRCLATLTLLSSITAVIAAPRTTAPWTLARSSHFEVYSHAGPTSAPTLLANFERMHAFFARQVGVAPDSRRAVRVICFGGREEYESFRFDSTADAYYLGTDNRDYIVMPACASGDFHTAAHEYAHLLIHSSGLTLPRWMAEGISEVASTVQIRERASSIGGDLPNRSRLLRSAAWMPLSGLFAVGEKNSGGPIFYAQSWALTAMLLLSPQYSPRFRLLAASLATGVGGVAALSSVYGISAENMAYDLRAWLANIPPPVPLAGTGIPALPTQQVVLQPYAARTVLADLRFALGDLDGAEAMYRALVQETGTAEVYSALGLVALRKNNAPAALEAWNRAMALGIADANICYRYATLADTRGIPAGEVRRALEKAIALDAGFDDARFKLALLLKNAGQPEPALAQLQAMRAATPAHAFVYWSVLADTLLDMGRRENARAAALRAREAAASDAERERAASIVYMAETDLAVQLTSEPDGPHFQTIRVPHDQPARNPFIESSDRIQRIEATLEQIECTENAISVVLASPSGDLRLAVPDPSRVQIRNSPAVSFEFTCGPQTPQKVLVEYTANKILRGLELH